MKRCLGRSTRVTFVVVALVVACGGGAPEAPSIDLDAVEELALRSALSDFAESQLRLIRFDPAPASRGEPLKTKLRNGTNMTLLGIDVAVTIQGPGGTEISPEPFVQGYHPTGGIEPRSESPVELDVAAAPGMNVAPTGSKLFARPSRVWVYSAGESIELQPMGWEEETDLAGLLEGLTAEQRVEVDSRVASRMAAVEPLVQLASATTAPSKDSRSSERAEAMARRLEAQREEAARLRDRERDVRRDAEQRQREARQAAPTRTPPAASPPRRAAAESEPEDLEFLEWWKGCRARLDGVAKASRALEYVAQRASFSDARKQRLGFIAAVNAAVETHESHPAGPLNEVMTMLLTEYIEAAKAVQAGRYIAYEGRLAKAYDMLDVLEQVLQDLGVPK